MKNRFLPQNTPSFFFWLFALAGIFFAVTAYSENIPQLIYFFWRPPFSLFIKIFCVLSFGFLALKWARQRPLPVFPLKLIGAIIFLPVLLLPIFRCYFKVPYVFCRACPDKCPWGVSRTFLFGAFVGLNLSEKFWCSCLCPFGTAQEAETQISKRRLRFASWLSVSSYAILIVVAGMYSLTLSGSSWLRYFENGRYAWVSATVFAAVLIAAAAFFIPKFWCRYICPVGTIAEAASRLQRLPRRPKPRTSIRR